MKKIQINIDWSVVFWIGFMTVFFWLLAKAVGLIHTLYWRIHSNSSSDKRVRKIYTKARWSYI